MHISIPTRFCGPPDSGNGGYTCGLIANALGVTSLEVTLRAPIPMEHSLQIVPIGNGGAQLRWSDALIAEATPAPEWSSIVLPTGKVTFDAAIEAEKASAAFGDHPFPTCFVCGPRRATGDGLRIFPGKLSFGQAAIGKSVSRKLSGGAVTGSAFGGSADLSVGDASDVKEEFAAPWIPAAEFADAAGNIRPEYIWAAMDCPTGFAAGFAANSTASAAGDSAGSPSANKLVTGRLAVSIEATVRAGEQCVLLSWPLAVDGRKHHAAGLLLGEDGSVRTRARATWIKID